ncbi:MAG: hypothetical protein NVSMB9_06770 [Isosphaeraceae bacterium]
MMRWVLVAVIVVLLSSAATVAIQMMPTSTTTNRPAFPLGSASATKARGLEPKAILEGPQRYEFGTLPQRTTGAHSWVVKNEGKADLKLWMISATCSCTLAKFKDGKTATVKPGESTEIGLEYETRDFSGDYEKGAEIGSNDPDLPQFSLHVHGKVFPAVMTMPPDKNVNFGSISNDVEDHTNVFAVFSKDRPDLKILKATTSNPDQVKVTWDPLSAEEAKRLEIAKGLKATVHVKGGLPLGGFREEVILTTDHPKQSELRMAVVGKMSGPVNLIPERLIMHQADGKAGASKGMIISVRGLRDTKFEVTSMPKGLQVAIEPRSNTAQKGRYRLLVSVPPGTPAQKIEGEVVLKSDHPKADKVIVPVSVWIQNAS